MRLRSGLLAFTVLTGCGWAAMADAETQPGGVGEVVVTAQFRDQSIQDTPLAITAISGQTLEERHQVNVQQIADQVPSVTLKPGASSFGPSLVASIRGVGQYNFHPALEPGVGVFVDDVYFATLTGAMVDLLDVDRIEVLRGPQGTLTGRNSIGGAIRIVSKKPTGSNTGYLEVSAGSRSLVSLRGSFDVKLTDTLSARISGALRNQKGYVRRLDFGCARPGQGLPPTTGPGNCDLGDPMGGIGNDAVRAALRYRPTDKLDVILEADYEREDHTGPGEVLLYANQDNPISNPAPGVPLDSRFICGPFCNFATFTDPAGPPGYPAFASSVSPQTTFSGWGLSATADIALTDMVKLTSITAYRNYDSSWSSDLDLSSATADLEHLRMHHRFFSQELRLNGEAGRLKYTIGGYYSSQNTHLNAFFDLRPFFIQYTTDDPIPAQTYAAFSTGIFSITDQLTLTGGIRYTHEQKKYTFYRYNLDGTVTDPAIQGVSNTASDGVVDYRVSLDYRINPSLLAYATISTGFKGGGINPLPFTAALALPFGPEKLTNYEIGLKSDLIDGHVRLNLTGFYDQYKDVQETRLSCPEFGVAFCSLVVNAGDAHTSGVEAELFARFANFQFDGAFSYIDFTFTKMNPSTFLPLTVVPPFVPQYKWSVGAQYRFELGAAGALTPRLDGAYQSSVFTNAANAATNQISPYTVWNAHLTWDYEPQHLSVALHVTNLFNKYYLLNKFDVASFTGTILGDPARPREFAVVVRKDF